MSVMLTLLSVYTGADVLHKWRVGGGSQVSLCWDGSTEKQTEEARMIHVVIDSTWRCQYELMFINKYGYM